MRKYLLCLCCLSSLLTYGQKSIIRHDALTDETNYYLLSSNRKDAVPVKNLSMKKQVPVNLTVSNFNPFYWGARVSVSKNVPDEGAGASGSISTFSAFSGMIRGFLPANFPLLDLKTEKSRGLSSPAQQKLIILLKAYSYTYSRIKSLCQQYNNLKNLEWRLRHQWS